MKQSKEDDDGDDDGNDDEDDDDGYDDCDDDDDVVFVCGGGNGDITTLVNNLLSSALRSTPDIFNSLRLFFLSSNLSKRHRTCLLSSFVQPRFSRTSFVAAFASWSGSRCERLLNIMSRSSILLPSSQSVLNMALVCKMVSLVSINFTLTTFATAAPSSEARSWWNWLSEQSSTIERLFFEMSNSSNDDEVLMALKSSLEKREEYSN